jgi:hypothetical protein
MLLIFLLQTKFGMFEKILISKVIYIIELDGWTDLGKIIYISVSFGRDLA